MTLNKITCILCGRGDATDEWTSADGELMVTCHGQNRPEHPGRRCTWNLRTGKEFRPGSPEQFQVAELFMRGKPHPFRDFPADFLYGRCNVIRVTAKDIGDVYGSAHGLFAWASDREVNGFIISALTLWSGTRAGGIQFRAFHEKTGDAEGGFENTRTIGKDGVFAPSIAGRNYEAVTLHEGPWGAIAQLWDAHEYGATNIGAIAVASAGTDPGLVKTTCKLLLPGIPIFILADNDEAGWAMRYRQRDIGIQISLPPVGDGKDYRDLPSDFRYEELVKIIYRHLRERDLAGGNAIPLSDEEIDIRLAKLIRTEFGLGARFAARHGKRCRYVEEWEKWIVFNGKYWERSTVQASSFAQHTINALMREALFLD